jgi:hypothetical protein
MRDYLNAKEKNQYMVLQSILQLLDGVRNTGINGPKVGDILEEWSKSSNITKEEHKNLKTSGTLLRKFLLSVRDRLSKKEQSILDKKIMKYDFRLVDEYVLKQVNRDIEDKFANAVVPREQFNDWCAEIMTVKCQGCTKNWNECPLHEVFNDNFIPESGYNCTNCRYAYHKE